MTKSTEDVVLRRPPSKPPRTFTASVIVDADTDADANTDVGSTAARKSVLSDTDIFRLIRTASATHKKSDTDDVSKHDETNDVSKRTDDDKKRTSTKSSTSSSSSSSDDDSNDVTARSRKEQSSKNDSSTRSSNAIDVPTSEAAAKEVKDRAGAKQDVDQPVGGAEQLRDDVPELPLAAAAAGDKKPTIVVIKNPRALAKEPNKKLVDENKSQKRKPEVEENPEANQVQVHVHVQDKKVDDERKKKKTSLDEMPNFRMAHAATVAVHGPGKPSKSSRKSSVPEDQLQTSPMVIEDDLNLDLNLFSTSKFPPNKKLPSASGQVKKKKKTKETHIPGQLAPEEEKRLEELEKEREVEAKRREEEEERKRKKRGEMEKKREEEEMRDREKLQKSRMMKLESEKPARAVRAQVGVEQTETLRHALKNLITLSDESNVTSPTSPTTTTVHLDIDDDVIMPVRSRTSSTSSSSSSSSVEVLIESHKPTQASAASRLVMDSGKGFYPAFLEINTSGLLRLIRQTF